MARRDAINTELAQLAPQPIPDLDQARQVLDDFSILWSRETDPAAKRQLLPLIFERVWLDEQRVVAVQPKVPFAPFFESQANQADARETATSGVCKERERRGGRVRTLPPHAERIEVWAEPPPVAGS